MSERLRWRRLKSSVFTKLMVVMLGMGLVIPIAVAGFFIHGLQPASLVTVQGLLPDYVALLAATGPNREEAMRAAARHQLAIRYEGPDGSFTTDETLPAIAEAQCGGFGKTRTKRPSLGGCLVVTQSGGRSYLFAWGFAHDLTVAHDRMLLALLAFIVLVVVAAHGLLRHALRPLQSLEEGVAALSEGNLRVAVPRTTTDEFGALTDAFNRMVDRVREMVQARDRLLLDVSHELRSPLTRMKVALELCPGDEHRQRLSKNVAEMEAMVTELLELERLRQGRGIHMDRSDLMNVLRDVVVACEQEPPGVTLGPAPSSSLLTMDAEKVRRVLSNLLENACKYSLPDSKPVNVTVSERDHAVEICVQDDGPGIPEDCLESVLEPFFRVDRSRSRRTGGYGLGLSLCKRIMEAHGGSILVANRPGRGAEVVLTFPKGASTVAVLP